MVTTCHRSLLETCRSAVGAAGSIVSNHKRYVIFRRLFLPRMSVHSCGVKEVLLVAIFIVAYLAATDPRFPASLFSYSVPALFVIAVVAAYFVVLVHERVVEESELQRRHLVVVNDRRVFVVGSVYGHQPGEPVRNVGHSKEELLLESLRREVPA